MSREKDKKIAEWLGWTIVPMKQLIDAAIDFALSGNDMPQGKFCSDWPHLSTSDADAITLLPELVERGYWWRMWQHPDSEVVVVNIGKGDTVLSHASSGSISGGITSAVTKLIEEGK